MPGTVTEMPGTVTEIFVRQREMRNVDRVDLPPVVYLISVRLCPENGPWKTYEFYVREIVALDTTLIRALAVIGDMALSGERGYPTMADALALFVERLKHTIIDSNASQ